MPIYLRNWIPQISWIYFAIIFLFFLGMSPHEHRQLANRDNLIERRTTELMPLLPDSVSYQTYKKIHDSTGEIVAKENLENMGLGNSWGTLNFHTSYYDQSGQSYFVLPGYEPTSFKDFYTYNGKNYIESYEKNGNFLKKQIHETKVKLVPDYDKDKLYVLIPISKQTKIFIQVIMILVAFLAIIYGLHSLIRMPWRLILNISKGEVFNEENIRAMNTIAIFLFAYAGITVVSSILLNLIFHKSVPDSVTFSYYNSFMDKRYTVIAGLVALLFARAFRRGYELENEVDLTV